MSIPYKRLTIPLLELNSYGNFLQNWVAYFCFMNHLFFSYRIGLKEPSDSLIPFKFIIIIISSSSSIIIKGLLNNLTIGGKNEVLQDPSEKTRDYTNVICQQIHID